jgi:hypothetical protein
VAEKPRQLVAVLSTGLEALCLSDLRKVAFCGSQPPAPSRGEFARLPAHALGASVRLKKTCAICAIWKGWAWLF